MERGSAKEKGRKKLIREKASALKKKLPRKAPANVIMRQAGRYRAIETARKQLNEARQAVAPDQEQKPYTAVDKVEAYSANIVHEAIRSPDHPPHSHHGNVSHRETHSQDSQPHKAPTPKECMRREAIKDARQEQSKNTSQQRRTRENRKQVTGQRQKALPSDTSSAGTSKAQIVKEQGRRYALDQAIKEIKTSSAKGAAKAGNEFIQKLGAAITRAVRPSSDDLILYGGFALIMIVPLIMLAGIAVALFGSGEHSSSYVPVSAEVEAYTPIIQFYANQYGIPEYTELIKAVMMQESGGQGTDPMQCSESGYNTRYPHARGAITDPEYSIDVGVQTLADAFQMAGVGSPIDLDQISLALQGYNYGSGYISWALANYGGYSELNAIEFSDMMAERYGWAGYGDKAYVSHVLHYYPIGRSFMSEGSAAMVAVAQTQIGNEGGLKFCEWYGYPYHVEWCAIFVSWVADQCGYLDAGILPRMEGVRPYVDWFIGRGQWKGKDYEPSPGDIIFLDWENDGLADHVGIVEKVENGFVYTVEGNINDVCAERRYILGSAPVYGFGLPLY